MKRDLDLIRDILLRVEGVPYGQELEGGFEENVYLGEDPTPDKPHPETPDPFFGRSKEVAAGHVHLLFEAGYIEGFREGGFHGGTVEVWAIRRLTMDGHDFLDAVRDPMVFSQTKSKLAKVGGAAGLEVVKAVAQGVINSMLGLGGFGAV